jgi:Cellulase (glycosyl hydrolase family 5)
MSNVIRAICAIAIAAAAAGAGPVTRASRVEGPLHTDRGVIRDANNREIRLVGVNSSGLEWGAGHPWTTGGCEDMRGGRHLGCYSVENGRGDEEWQRIDRWGFNSVRLPIAWANLEPTPPTSRGGRLEHHWNEEYLRVLDGVIAACERHHLSVILSMHQWAWSPALAPEGKNANLTKQGNGFPAWLYGRGYTQIRARREFFEDSREISPGYTIQSAFSDAWAMVARRYAGRRCVVGADLLNEPYLAMEGQPKGGHLPLDGFFARVGAAVHAANPALLLIVEADPPFSPIEKRPSLPNLVYSIHLYPKCWVGSGSAKLEDRLARARKWNVPLWVGEFDRFGGATAGMPEMLEAFRQNHIGWAYWAYSRASKPLAKGGRVQEETVAALQRAF